MTLTLNNRNEMAAWIGKGAHKPDDPGSDVLLVTVPNRVVVISLGSTVERRGGEFVLVPATVAQPTETVASFEHGGRVYEIDHLGIGDPSQFAEFMVYQDGRAIADFTTDAVGLHPELRSPLPSTDDLIIQATAAVDAARTCR
jgi:hypothetical protein